MTPAPTPAPPPAPRPGAGSSSPRALRAGPARPSSVRPGTGPEITGAGSPPAGCSAVLRVVRLPATAAVPEPGNERQTVAGVLRNRVTEFLTGVRHTDPVTVQARVRRDPAAGTRIELALSGRAVTVAGHAARCRDLLAGLVDLASHRDEPGPHDKRHHPYGRDDDAGGRAWRLTPAPAGRPPGYGAVSWPVGGLRWAALLDAVERSDGPCGVHVTLVPMAPPLSALPVLRRAIRRADGRRPTLRDDRDDRDDRDRAAGSGETAALDLLESTPVVFHATLTVTAHDPAVAAELAAALGAPGLTPEPAAAPSLSGALDAIPSRSGALEGAPSRSGTLPAASSRSGTLEAIRTGAIVAPRTAAGLVPLTALPMDAVTVHARRPAVVARYAPRTGAAGVWLGRSAGGRPYRLRVPDLNQHLLVTGLTGFGKTTTVMTLLRRLWREHAIPFLVIDPEKTEYLPLGAVTLSLGRDGTQINPLAVPEGVDRAAFADTVAECLDAATGLSATWPFAAAALRNAVTDLYHGDDPPSVATFYRAVLEQAGAHGGAGEQAANLRASLGQRVQSLVAGAGGDALAGGPGAGLDWGRLLSAPAVITLAGFGDRTARQLAFGLLLAGMVAYRRANPLPRFGHLAVLEEAHLLLGNGPGAGHSEGVVTAAAEATATAISTQRSYGQGFVLVSQSPRQLPGEVTRLFPNRLTHRLAEDPGEGALGQVADQVPMLGRGEAFVVDAGGHPAPVWVTVVPEPGGATTPEAPTEQVAGTSSGYGPAGPAPSSENGSAYHAGPPERIWCQACPRPCAARHWLRLVPEVESGLAGVPEDGQADAAMGMLEHLIVRDRMRPSYVELHAGFYCVIARTLTRARATDRRRAAAAQREARRVADRVAEDTRRGAELDR
ncbi:DUF87 domain-containing protein [Nonomuraea sp. NPDC050691]|uniref:ATP-binding protein n=1 Tax=Nonomuraea sp. NPDC050691 TaxID=3155661 RepID=UPI0034041444